MHTCQNCVSLNMKNKTSKEPIDYHKVLTYHISRDIFKADRQILVTVWSTLLVVEAYTFLSNIFVKSKEETYQARA